jgi:hypothetical protein
MKKKQKSKDSIMMMQHLSKCSCSGGHGVYGIGPKQLGLFSLILLPMSMLCPWSAFPMVRDFDSSTLFLKRRPHHRKTYVGHNELPRKLHLSYRSIWATGDNKAKELRSP